MRELMTFKIPVHLECGRICVRDSDIEGLFLEVDTIEELDKELQLIAPVLLETNHQIRPEDFGDVTLVINLAPDNSSLSIEKDEFPEVLWKNVSSFKEFAVA